MFLIKKQCCSKNIKKQSENILQALTGISRVYVTQETQLNKKVKSYNMPV